MSYYRLILSSLRHYLRKNLAVMTGIAVSTAVITGALVTGDSVRQSLKDLVGMRLGQVTHVLTSGDRFFTDSLAYRLQPDLQAAATPVLQLDAFVTAGGGEKRISNIRVYGIEDSFDELTGAEGFYSGLTDEEVIISDNLAARLDAVEGEELLFRIRKAATIPSDAPFVSDAETTVPVRARIKGIAGLDQTGRFSLQNIQSAPFNAFFSKACLERIMDQQGLSNLILFSGTTGITAGRITASLEENWNLADAGLRLSRDSSLAEWLLTSARVFLDDQISSAIKVIDTDKTFWFTYFVNEIVAGHGSAPYSFVSTLPDDRIDQDGIILNEWLASDLHAVVGDTIRLKYFLVGPLRELTEQETPFVVREIVPLSGVYADRNLMPEIPGLTDAGNCRDWETSIPIDLEKIRKKDEDYWNLYAGTPKAFINLSQATGLWQNRFGRYTQVRFDADTDREEIEKGILRHIKPSDLGFSVTDPVSEGLQAASGGVDFGQLFIGLSFFLLLSGMILTALLVMYNLESRKEEAGTLKATGWSIKHIRMINLLEGTVVAVAGGLLGLIFTLVYNTLIFKALNGVWNNIVLTDSLSLHFRPGTLVLGVLLGLIVSTGIIFLSINRFLKSTVASLHRKQTVPRFAGKKHLVITLAVVSGLVAISLILIQVFSTGRLVPGYFFAAGSLMLMSLLLFTYLIFIHWENKPVSFLNSSAYFRRSVIRNRRRSLSVIILFAIGVFLVISIGANRKDTGSLNLSPSGGTGGFLLFAESTLPLLENLNKEEVRKEAGFETPFSVVQFKKIDGDDASCLNLNRVSHPPLLGVPEGALAGRFSFVDALNGLNRNGIWDILDKPLPGGEIPAVADQTVIQWGLGRKIGDTLQYTNERGDPVRLVLAGGLANSVFQGHLLVSEQFLAANFPSASGTRIILFDGEPQETVSIKEEFIRSYRDYGIEILEASEKLAQFNSVENTYLSIFLVMGALAMLLGTIGLGIILIRSLQERKKELALLRATGFSRVRILSLIFLEYSYLLLIGIVTGGAGSVASVLPGILSPTGEVSLSMLMGVLGILLLNGLLWILLLEWAMVKKKSLISGLSND